MQLDVSTIEKKSLGSRRRRDLPRVHQKLRAELGLDPRPLFPSAVLHNAVSHLFKVEERDRGPSKRQTSEKERKHFCSGPVREGDRDSGVTLTRK